MIALGVAGSCSGGLIAVAIWLAAWVEWTNDPDAGRLWRGWLTAIGGSVVALSGYTAATGRGEVPSPRR